ncbi:MAG TPA: glycosyltransferase [Steroidobacteraceae bacterium]|nr:glycosyltransferase [Steroidobacteraceae bacterium]HRX89350.1 glycosyltransferase [Steroidobacteraceae bacterium]
MSPEISIVIPVYNEEAGLPLLFARLYPALDALQRSYEVIFVDDGSRDRSIELLRETVEQHPTNARAMILAHNVGQHLAILAAFERARGTYVITLDADLQNPPEEIGAVVRALDEGADYVGTIRTIREDVWWRRTASRWVNRVRERTTKIRITDQGCMLRGYDRRIVEAVNHCGEVTPFVPALAYTFARRPVEIPVKHAERAAGESKYSMFQLMRLNFDLMTGYSLLPLQIFSVSGILIAFLSLLFVVYLAVRRLLVGPEAAGVFTLFGIAFFLLGCVLFGLGIVGEYVGRIFEQVRSRPRYVVAEFLGDQRSVPRGDRAATRVAP